MLNLVQIQERLKDVPMASLMSYANGQNPQIPPFLALGEMNRRKKMQEEAAATQAQEMEGAPTVKQQIEQASGLLALQGSRQRAAAQQQQGVQANMPMAAPNTTTSEPAQLASGGAINDAMPRDFQRGGIASAMNPEMMKKLMAMKAMRQRKAGIDKLPINTFKRPDYARGGIVAFAGPEGSVVEGKEANEDDERKQAQSAMLKKFADLIAKREGVAPLQDRLRTEGYDKPIETGKEELAALMAKQQRQQEADTVARRVMALDPFRLGKSMDAYLKGQESQQSQVEQDMAKLRDIQAKSARDEGIKRITEGRTGEITDIKDVMDLLGKQGEVGYKEALGQQAIAGKKTEWDKYYDIELRKLEAQGEDITDPVVQAKAAERVAYLKNYAGPRAENAATAIDAQNARAAQDELQKATKFGGALFDSLLRAKTQAERDKILLDYLNRLRAQKVPPLPPITSSAELPQISGLPSASQAPGAPKPGNVPSATPSAPSGSQKVIVDTPQGKIEFPNQAAADEFKRKAGLK